MSRLLGGQIGSNDQIFVHIKGRSKKIDVNKLHDGIGLTITDNGAGYAFIKRIKEDSFIDQQKLLLETIDDNCVVGCRHLEVAKMLKDIPKGTTFTLRVIEPLKSGACKYIYQNTCTCYR